MVHQPMPADTARIDQFGCRFKPLINGVKASIVYSRNIGQARRKSAHGVNRPFFLTYARRNEFASAFHLMF